MLKITYNLINFLIFSFPKVIKKATFFRQEIDLSIDQLFLDSILKFLKKSPNFQFTILNEMTAIDFFTKSTRFIVTYKLLSIRYNLRLSISVFLKKPEVFSVNQQFNSSI
jgi:NADH:ubiquinone oxidoreductase subunit C